MFDLGIVDHVRLNLTRTGENYTVHASAAERLAGLTSRIRIGVLTLLLIAAAAAILSLLDLGRSYRVAAVIAAGLAAAGHAAYIAWGFEGRVNAHRVCAHNLWLVCERHRALLAEIQDGAVDRGTILRRRDELTDETHAAYAQMFPLDQPAYERLRQSAIGTAEPDRSEAAPEAHAGSGKGSRPDLRESPEALPN